MAGILRQGAAAVGPPVKGGVSTVAQNIFPRGSSLEPTHAPPRDEARDASTNFSQQMEDDGTRAPLSNYSNDNSNPDADSAPSRETRPFHEGVASFARGDAAFASSINEEQSESLPLNTGANLQHQTTSPPAPAAPSALPRVEEDGGQRQDERPVNREIDAHSGNPQTRAETNAKIVEPSGVARVGSFSEATGGPELMTGPRAEILDEPLRPSNVTGNESSRAEEMTGEPPALTRVIIPKSTSIIERGVPNQETVANEERETQSSSLTRQPSSIQFESLRPLGALLQETRQAHASYEKERMESQHRVDAGAAVSAVPSRQTNETDALTRARAEQKTDARAQPSPVPPHEITRSTMPANAPLDERASRGGGARQQTNSQADESPRLTIRRLDVQIINQPPPPVVQAPLPSPTAAQPLTDTWETLERHHLGNARLMF
ncbi:MAG: hypothetical protein WCD76_08735 [Pyrinomonadaceae bacterium]